MAKPGHTGPSLSSGVESKGGYCTASRHLHIPPHSLAGMRKDPQVPRVLACWWPVQLRPRDAKRPHTGLHQALSQNRGAAPPTGLCAEACTTQPNTATSGMVMPGQSCLPLPQMGHIPHVWMSAVAWPGGQRPPWLRAWPGNSSQDVPSLHATGSPWVTKHMVPVGLSAAGSHAAHTRGSRRRPTLCVPAPYHCAQEAQDPATGP